MVENGEYNDTSLVAALVVDWAVGLVVTKDDEKDG